MTQTVEDVGETQKSKVCAQPDVKERFKVLFSGPQFAVENTYFEHQVSNSAHTLFEQHCKKVMSTFSMKFHSTSGKEEYVQNVSSPNWEAYLNLRNVLIHCQTVLHKQHSFSSCRKHIH